MNYQNGYLMPETLPTNKRYSKISKEQVTLIYKLYDESKTLSEIAKQVGCSTCVVRNRIANRFAGGVNSELTFTELNLLKLAVKGFTIDEMASMKKAPRATVKRQLKAILQKTGASDRDSLLAWYQRQLAKN